MQPSESPYPHSAYHAYLLRLWREHADSPWRISLQLSTTASGSSTRLGFADLESLVDYLLTVMTKAPDIQQTGPVDNAPSVRRHRNTMPD